MKCSPRTRGWSHFIACTAGANQPFPMYVGVIRQAFIMIEPVPHECGGDPGNAQVTSEDHPCSPRVWGWSQLWRGVFPKGFLFPMHVGVIQSAKAGHAPPVAVPHGCGGDPESDAFDDSYARLFPTNVGVILITDCKGLLVCCCSPRVWGWSLYLPGAILFIPRVGGGVSGFCFSYTACSPRSWGWPRERFSALG